MLLKKIISLIAILTFSVSFSQQQKLTHHLSSWERELMQHRDTQSFSETTAPTGDVRNIAEWEPMEGVIVAYTGEFGIPLSLIAEMSQDSKVTTIVSNVSEENTVNNIYSSNGVNLSNCTYMYQDPNSYWTRDYSPWYIAVDNEVAIVNFPYNRPRPNDDDVPILMANELGVNLYGMNVIQTGGNYMCDGYGIGASTDLVWDENTISHTQIASKMEDYLGITTYHVTADPLDDYIKHIDCWGKFLDVDKVLITQVPTSDYRYNDYEAVTNYFASQNCSWGYPYEIIRVQAANYNDYDVNPYTNSLILNHKVFVPQTGSSLDDDAIAVYESAMPGYQIFGVYSDSWINSDALHCRTHGIADREMLFIKHYPLHGDLAYQSNYTIEADIVSYNGSPLSTNFPKLHYKQNSGTWEVITMTNTVNNTYTAEIPALSGNNTVAYYIEAQNDNNKYETHPSIGISDPHTFTYSGGTVQINDFHKEVIAIYPNPASEYINVKLPLTSGKIFIYNTVGQLVYSKIINTKNTHIDISNFETGVYLLRYIDQSNTSTQKLIIR
jgi:agmatine/peptidylarginine deiminase